MTELTFPPVGAPAHVPTSAALVPVPVALTAKLVAEVAVCPPTVTVMLPLVAVGTVAVSDVADASVTVA